MRVRRRWQGPREQIKGWGWWGDGGAKHSAGLGTREESCDEPLPWEEWRMMGGLCQQAWEGEEDGDEGGVCLWHWGFWDEQNCWLCKLCIWVFNEPLSSCLLATELLLLAGEEQHKYTHTKTSFAVQKFLKLLHKETHTHCRFRNEE